MSGPSRPCRDEATIRVTWAKRMHERPGASVSLITTHDFREPVGSIARSTSASRGPHPELSASVSSTPAYSTSGAALTSGRLSRGSTKCCRISCWRNVCANPGAPVSRASVHDVRQFQMVGARGFEPLTSSASRKRSPPELSARTSDAIARSDPRRGPESNRCTRLCRPLPDHSATPPGRSAWQSTGRRDPLSDLQTGTTEPRNRRNTRDPRCSRRVRSASVRSRVPLGPCRPERTSACCSSPIPRPAVRTTPT